MVNMSWIGNLWALFYFYLRPLNKWFLRKTTRLCELQRICYGESRGAARTLAVEQSLRLTRNSQMQLQLRSLDEACDSPTPDDQVRPQPLIDKTLDLILSEKKIKRDLHIQFVHSMRYCLSQMMAYRRLLVQVEALRATAYNSDDLNHERRLLQLWSLLQPGVPLSSRVTKQWQNIGFQGDDPKTDFRGMGLLSLENLLYFAKEYNSAAKHILSHSHHPRHGFYSALQSFNPSLRYSFAIVGINLTHMAYRLLNDGSAKTHLFNVTAAASNSEEVPGLKHFHHFYCYLFVEFDKFWLRSKPKDVMEFNRIRDLFENNVRVLLSDTTTCLKINITVDNV